MEPATSSSAPRLIDEVRRRIRIRHHACSTERTCAHWTKFFVRFHRMRHPREMGAAEVEAFLSHLASERKASASTRNQAKGGPAVSIQGRQEVKTLLEALHGTTWLIASLRHGTGRRVIEG